MTFKSSKASDPDVGDQGRLVYSLSVDSTYFDVDPSSGLVFVVSAAELAGQKVELEVLATDLQGLSATAKVEVTVGGSVSSSDVVVISLNQPANTVENKIPGMESSLGQVLGWTVDVIGVSSTNGGAPESRLLRAAARSLVSFICLDGGTVVSSKEVTSKLQSQSEAVRAELVKVFGDSLQFELELTPEPQSSASNQAVVIALGVLVALSMLGLIVAVVFVFRFKKMNKHQGSDKDFDIGRRGEGFDNMAWKNSEPSEQRKSQEKRREDDRDSVRSSRQTDNNGSHTSSL
ncbi:uncharacterized protein [Pagrus major]|uniref:uncharacterized protein n=1 Tax=Pagrus major TaxID=143350 RepID=UPI003CC84517